MEPPKKLEIPDAVCDRELHYLHTEKGMPDPDKVAWDKNGKPVCKQCEIHDIAVFHALHSATKKHHCTKDHPAHHLNSDFVVESKNGKPHLERHCTDCEPIRKAASLTGGYLRWNTDLQRHELEYTRRHLRMNPDTKKWEPKPDTPDTLHIVSNEHDVPAEINSPYYQRGFRLGRPISKNINVGELFANSSRYIQHLIGRRVGMDHIIPLQGGGWHDSRNGQLALSHKEQMSAELSAHNVPHNSAKGSIMPTEEDLVQNGQHHLVPYVRALNPQEGKTFHAKGNGYVIIGPDGNALARNYENDMPSGGVHSHYIVPGINPFKDDEFLKHSVTGEVKRNPAGQQWLDSIAKHYGPIPEGFDMAKTPIFSRQALPKGHSVFLAKPTTDKGGVGFSTKQSFNYVPTLHPVLRQHILNGLSEHLDDTNLREGEKDLHLSRFQQYVPEVQSNPKNFVRGMGVRQIRKAVLILL